jgi:hypothetical protein
MAIDPFSRRRLTPDEWRARARIIESQLEGLTIAELLRGGRAEAAKHGELSGRDGHGYDPNQPRVPAGHPDGGQWVDQGSSNAGDRINDPRILSDVTPDNYWLPGAQYAGEGHHFPPRAIWQNWPLQPETRRVFNKAVSGPIPLRLFNPLTRDQTFYHRFDDMHRAYNIAVTRLMERYMRRHGITPEAMTPMQAHRIVEAIHASRDSRIRDYNEIVKLVARLFRMRRFGND